MVDQLGNEEDIYYQTIVVDEDGLLDGDYIQRHASLHDSYRACFSIVQQLPEDEVKDVAKEHGIYYNPLDEDNGQKYLFEWEYRIYPKLQKDVARYFCAKCEGVKDLSKYINANEEEGTVAMEVESDDMDLEVETSCTTISDSNNVDKEEEVGAASATATSSAHFKPIANTESEQDLDIEQADKYGGDAEDDSLDFGGGGFDDSFGDELDSTHIKEDIQQSTVGVALDAPEPDIEVLEDASECNMYMSSVSIINYALSNILLNC